MDKDDFDISDYLDEPDPSEEDRYPAPTEKSSQQAGEAPNDGTAYEPPEEEVPLAQMGYLDILISKLPTPLAKLVWKNLALSAGGIWAGIMAIIFLPSPAASLLFFFLALWGVGGSLSILRAYKREEIIERVLICTGVAYNGVVGSGRTAGPMGKRYIKVSFRDTNEEIPNFFQYTVTAKVGTFTPGNIYLTYVRRNNPAILMTYDMI